MSRGNPIISRRWTLIFARFLPRYGPDNDIPVSFLRPQRTKRNETRRNGREGQEPGKNLFRRFESTTCTVQVQKRSSFFFSGKRSLPIENASTTIDFRFRIHMVALCVDLFIKNQNARAAVKRRRRRRRRRGGGRKKSKKERKKKRKKYVHTRAEER